MTVHVIKHNKTVKLKRNSIYREAYIELAKTGMVRKSFKDRYAATSFRHSAMVKFKGFKLQTGITTDNGGFLIVTVKIVN